MVRSARVNPVGVCTHLNRLSTSNMDNQLNLIQAAGIKWIRQEISWSGIEPTSGNWNFAPYDHMINGANQRGIGFIGLLAQYGVPSWYGTPSTQPPLPADYANWISVVVARYPTVLLWEVGNEPNVDHFWTPAANAAAYTALLQAAYPTIKAANKNAKVISAGIATNNPPHPPDIDPQVFLTQMYASGAQGYMDYIGYHPYSWPNGPDYTGSGETFSELASAYSIMNSNGDGNKKIIATEVGWTTSTSIRGVTEANQATYISRVYTKIMHENFQYVTIACVYDFVDDGTDITNDQDNFGILHTDYTQKASYTSILSALNDYNSNFVPVGLNGQRFYALRTFGSPVQYGTGLTNPPSDSVSISDSTALTNNRSIASELVSLADSASLIGLPAPVESVALADSAALVGKSQIIESVQLSESSLLKAYKWHALRTFGSPVKLPLPPKKYAPRVFGSPVKFNPRTTAYFVAPPDYVALSDSIALLNTLTFSSTVIKRYASRAFGSPVTIIVRPEVAALADKIFISSSTAVAPENVSVSDTVSLVGVPMPTDSVNALELTTSLSGSAQIVDSTPIADISNPTGITTIASESVQPGEEIPLLTGRPSPVEGVSLTDQTALQGVSSIAPESVQTGESALPTGQPSTVESVQPGEGTASFVGALSSVDNAQLSDPVGLLGASSIASEPVAISDAQSQSGSSALNESVSPLDVLSLAGLPSLASEIVSLSDFQSQAGASSFIDSVQIRDDLLQSGSSQLVENIQISEILSLLGITSNTIQIKKYALRAFGSPVSYIVSSVTDFASLCETLSLQSSSSLAAEQVSLFEALSQTGNPTLIESVSLAEENILLAGNMALAAETAQLSEALSFAGLLTPASESVQLSDSQRLTGSLQSTDSAQIAELLSLAGARQFTESVQTIEIITLSGITQLNAETVQIIESLLHCQGAMLFSDNALLSEIFGTITVGTPRPIVIVARGRDGIAIGNSRDGIVIGRSNS